MEYAFPGHRTQWDPNWKEESVSKYQYLMETEDSGQLRVLEVLEQEAINESML